MISPKRVTSVDGRRFIEISEIENGVFVLKKFVVKFDEEEGVEYTVRYLPDPGGRYADLVSAREEAERILR